MIATHLSSRGALDCVSWVLWPGARSGRVGGNGWPVYRGDPPFITSEIKPSIFWKLWAGGVIGSIADLQSAGEGSSPSWSTKIFPKFPKKSVAKGS